MTERLSQTPDSGIACIFRGHRGYNGAGGMSDAAESPRPARSLRDHGVEERKPETRESVVELLDERNQRVHARHAAGPAAGLHLDGAGWADGLTPSGDGGYPAGLSY